MSLCLHSLQKTLIFNKYSHNPKQHENLIFDSKNKERPVIHVTRFKRPFVKVFLPSHGFPLKRETNQDP